MPQPAAVTAEAERVIDEWRSVEQRLQDRLRLLASQGRASTRLRAMLSEIDPAIDALHDTTRVCYQGRLPLIWWQGALATGLPFAWTQTSRDAIQALAARNWDDLLAVTRHVARDTKAALRALARAGAWDVIGAGSTSSRAARDTADYVQDLAGRVFTVTYRDGARHTVADWADTAIRTQTALAYNDGALHQYEQHRIEWVECVDGPACGLTSHDDPDLANGLVVDLATAREYPLAHPRCARSWLPRTDIASKAGATRANDRRDMPALEAEADLERERAEQSTVTGARFTRTAETRRVNRRRQRTR